MTSISTDADHWSRLSICSSLLGEDDDTGMISSWPARRSDEDEGNDDGSEDTWGNITCSESKAENEAEEWWSAALSTVGVESSSTAMSLDFHHKCSLYVATQ